MTEFRGFLCEYDRPRRDLRHGDCGNTRRRRVGRDVVSEMIYPGDIVAIRGAGWLSDGIAKAEYPNGEPAQSATHVGLFISGDPYPIVIEALTRVKTNPLYITTSQALEAYALHDISLTERQRETIIAKACTFSADDYGYLDLIAQRLDATFSTTWWTDRMAGLLSHWPICSYVVGAAYAAIGLNFGVDTASVRPSDVLSFALSNPKIYTVTVLK